MEDCIDRTPTRLHIRDVRALDAEVRHIVTLIQPDFDLTEYQRVFSDVVRLFIGDYPGYQASSTEYHDMTHTLAVLLATARLLHGVHLDLGLDERLLGLGLYAALMHDLGYMKTDNDTEGTGAKYTLDHVRRGVDFLSTYFSAHDMSDEDIADIADIVRATDMAKDFTAIPYSSPGVRLVGQVVGSADILAQMADELYVEKLPALYREFKEGGLNGYESEYDLLRETLHFSTQVRTRLKTDLGDVAGYMRNHFKHRWDLDTDVYELNITKNLEFLSSILETHGKEFQKRLRRNHNRRPPFV